MFCQACGNALPDNAKFCDQCGANVERMRQQWQQWQQEQQGQPAQSVQPTQPVQPAQPSQPVYPAQNLYGQQGQQGQQGQPAQRYTKEPRMSRRQFYNTFLTPKTKRATKIAPILFILLSIFSYILLFLIALYYNRSSSLDMVLPTLYLVSGLIMLFAKNPILLIVLPSIILAWVFVIFINYIANSQMPSLMAFAWPILAMIQYPPNKTAYDAYKRYVATGAVPDDLI